MTNSLSGNLSDGLQRKWPISRFIAGFLLFSAAYALINQYLLVQSILYRAAAYDYSSAGLALLSFAVQALILFAAMMLLPRRWFVAALILAVLSSSINIIYSQIVGDTLDLQKSGWLLTEARQAGEAAGEFAAPLGLAIGKILLAAALLICARKIMRGPLLGVIGSGFRSKGLVAASCFLLLLPSFIWPLLGLYPLATERNIYGYAAAILTADPPPPRGPVTQTPDKNAAVKKIIWLVDESVSHDGFTKVIKPQITHLDFIDLGETASMGHCSTPSNVALRSGVNVRNVHEKTDLRRTPSVWGYAAKAGFSTMLIDGQVSGPPQNLLLPPEKALIDHYENAANGMRTDLEIARSLNASLKTAEKQFVYALLRGVHFQYRDHYPKDMLPADSSTQAQYDKAISYSKDGFFDVLLDGISRSEVAIFYTSDHGQNIEDGVTPHCSGHPVAAEFSVPLIAFLPADVQTRYGGQEPGGRSLSQLFPSTLALMGYDTAYAAKNYDNILNLPTARYVWFGRGVVPVKDGGTIDVQAGDRFPGR